MGALLQTVERHFCRIGRYAIYALFTSETQQLHPQAPLPLSAMITTAYYADGLEEPKFRHLD